MKQRRTINAKAAFVLPAAGLLLGSCVTAPFDSSILQFTGLSARFESPRHATSADGSIAPLSTGSAPGASSAGLALPSSATSAGLTDAQKRILAGARYFLGKNELVYGGRSYTYDCTGTILAIYAYAGIDLMPRFDAVTGNGVERLYKIMRDNNLLTAAKLPEPGDIVFWDNTYDENGNGLWDDQLTHAGIVIGVTPQGEITYEHQNYAQGIVTEEMNLLHPDSYRGMLDGVEQIINSPMRMRGSPPGPSWLSGQLFRAFGRGYLLAS